MQQFIKKSEQYEHIFTTIEKIKQIEKKSDKTGPMVKKINKKRKVIDLENLSEESA